MSLLAVESLVKNYPDFSLGPLNLDVALGTSVGLVGANGAGKTTLFRSIMGTLRRQQGTVRVAGQVLDNKNPRPKAHIGHVGDYTPLFDNWSGQKNLEAFSKFYRTWSSGIAQDVARRLNLDLLKKVGSYSTGQRTKMAIVLALAHQPDLLLLDEPSNGLDPVSRENFQELLFEFLGDESRSIIYATHHIGEIEQLADRLVFLSQGLVVRDEIKEDLAQSWRKLSFRSENLPAQIPHTVSHRRELPYHEIISDNAAETEAFLSSKGIEAIESTRLTIEKITVEILRNAAREIHHV